MYLRFDSRRAAANDVKLAAMTDRSPTIGRRLLVVTGLALLAAAATMVAAGATASLVGQKAPDFALPAAVGSNVRLSEYRGQAVVISFWSSRCSVCARQLMLLDRLYSTYRSSGLVVLAVSVDDDPLHAEDYARAHVAGFPLLLDSAKTVSRAYAIDRLPSTVLIDRSGTIRYWHGDDRADDASYVTQIRALLDDSVAAPLIFQ
jgi:peroxiredoxin